MKHNPPLSCELHKHKSDEDKDRIPGGPTANIAAAAHIEREREKADLGEMGLLLRSEKSTELSEKLQDFIHR